MLQQLRQTNTNLDFQKPLLIGHSNGGDMSALFAHKYPELVEKLITLDSRRMPLPRTGRPRVYSLRSSDQPADKGVLPSRREQKKFGITIIRLPATRHDEMDNDANEMQRSEINTYINRFLKN